MFILLRQLYPSCNRFRTHLSLRIQAPIIASTGEALLSTGAPATTDALPESSPESSSTSEKPNNRIIAIAAGAAGGALVLIIGTNCCLVLIVQR